MLAGVDDFVAVGVLLAFVVVAFEPDGESEDLPTRKKTTATIASAAQPPMMRPSFRRCGASGMASCNRRTC